MTTSAANCWTRQPVGNLTAAQLLAMSLRIPAYGTLHPVAVSTLKLTPPVNPATGKRPKNKPTITHVVRDNNWGIEVTEKIESGATLADISHRFLGGMTKEEIDSKDCIIVTCMLNAPNGMRQLDEGEMSGMGAEMVGLCQRLLQHKRGAADIGGDGELWGFNEFWDPMVQPLLLICRSHGIPAIDGTRYFRNLEREEGGGTS